MDQFGIGEYCIDDSELSGDALVKIFIKAEQNLDEIFEKELRCIRIEGSRVQRDFAELSDNAHKEFK